jgi:ribosomal protein L21E
MRILSLVIAASFWLFASSASAQALCSVGDKAQVLWKGTWYPAKVTNVNDDQSKCYIRYDGYGSNWDEWVGADRFKKAGGTPSGAIVQGSKVQCLWKNGGTWYSGVVAEKTGNAVFIHYNDGDKEHTTVDKCRPTGGSVSATPSAPMEKGSAVSCKWKGGSWYPGVIAEKTGNSVFIHYNDGDKEHTKLSMCRPR